MKEYTPDELQTRHKQFLESLKKHFKGDRLKKLLHMYSDEELGTELVMAPASGNRYYHNAYVGGYYDHILNVLRCTMKQAQLYKELGGELNFTPEELIFSALHHDLGKLGQKGIPYYIDQDSDWHRNKGIFFKMNPELSFMKIQDRSLFTLQSYGVQVSENEHLSIKLHDGLYDEANKSYLITWDPSSGVRTSLVMILQMGDYIAMNLEKDSIGIKNR